MTQARLTRHLVGAHLFPQSIRIFDVGCSGGFGRQWDAFGSALDGVGFDPLEAEIDHLRKEEKRVNIRYETAYLGLSSMQLREKEAYFPSVPPTEAYYEDYFARSSGIRAAQLTSFNYEKEIFNSGARLRYTEKRFSIDEYVAKTGSPPDMIKTDTDGFDIEVLMGAGQTLSSVLGVQAECQFNASAGRYANTFANVDRFLRVKGFAVFDLQPTRYSRAALPAPFQYDLFAQTTSGPVIFSDVLFFRDLARDECEIVFGLEITPERVIKMAALMELYGLSDCAAELLIKRADRLPFDVNEMLDLLVPDDLGPNLSYREYIRRFETDPEALFPSRSLIIKAKL
jgi:hypothetical protein